MKKIVIVALAALLVPSLAAAAGPALQVGAAITPLNAQPGSVVGPGVPTVLICGKPAAVAGDQTLEYRSLPPGGIVPAPGTIVGGSGTVFIGGKASARAGDSTSNGGKLLGGCPTVTISG